MPDIHSNTFYGIRFLDGDVCSVQSSVADLHEGLVQPIKSLTTFLISAIVNLATETLTLVSILSFGGFVVSIAQEE